jgi:hypothetical protein
MEEELKLTMTTCSLKCLQNNSALPAPAYGVTVDQLEEV